MLCREVEICNRLGLHARAAAKLATLASAYASHIELRNGHRTVNAKSIMGVMMLAASKGTTIELRVSGEDEERALNDIEALIRDRFGEGE